MGQKWQLCKTKIEECNKCEKCKKCEKFKKCKNCVKLKLGILYMSCEHFKIRNIFKDIINVKSKD